MGPGILIKALLQGSFSLMVFGWAQILMDLQPLLSMITGEGELHGFSHTVIGATLFALLAALTGKHLSETGLKMLGLAGNPTTPIRWRIAFISAFIGTYSHVLLDSIMHSDIKHLYPLEINNQMHGIITAESLYQLCVYSGLLGATIYVAVRAFLAKQKNLN